MEDSQSDISTISITLRNGKYKAEAVLYWYADDTSTVYLSNLKVAKEIRQQGFGKYLMTLQEKITYILRANTICLWVRKGSWLHDWYKSLGYKKFNKHYKKGFIWMSKDIIRF